MAGDLEAGELQDLDPAALPASAALSQAVVGGEGDRGSIIRDQGQVTGSGQEHGQGEKKKNRVFTVWAGK